MKTNSFNPQKKYPAIVLFLLLIVGINQSTHAFFQENSQDYIQYKGDVVDSESNKPVTSAILTVSNTNISTITNAEGEFSLKVPVGNTNNNVIISSLGYITVNIPLSEFKQEDSHIQLNPSVIELSEVDVEVPKDASELVKKTLQRKGENNVNDHLLMTAFYRETIKRRNRNVSLAEAVVSVYKKPYSSFQKDDIEMYKSRKSTDYKRLDTVAVKLQGGPFNPLYGDLMKYPEYMFSADLIDDYSFSIEQSTVINNKHVYVVNFKPLPNIIEPRYYGKLYIDSNNLALVSASYDLNVENEKLASELFVRKRPNGIKVYPTDASYKVDYREKDGRWYYGYSNISLTFKINDRKKIFNTVYTVTSEMAVTDWEKNENLENLKPKLRLRPSVVISDEASGFSDPEFWGAHNVIEPEKSIETAISKIKRRLDRTDSNGN